MIPLEFVTGFRIRKPGQCYWWQSAQVLELVCCFTLADGRPVIRSVSTGVHKWDGDRDKPSFVQSINVTDPDTHKPALWHGWIAKGMLCATEAEVGEVFPGPEPTKALAAYVNERRPA